MKDKKTRKSKGVAFINYLRTEDAESCASAVNNIEVNEQISLNFESLSYYFCNSFKLFLDVWENT